MRFKTGVKMPRVLDPRMHVAFDAIEWAWIEASQLDEDTPMEPTITSWADGVHKVGSYHYNGRAVDVRTKTMRRAHVPLFVADLKRRIGALGFDVVLEDFNGPNEHLHLELDKRADE